MLFSSGQQTDLQYRIAVSVWKLLSVLYVLYQGNYDGDKSHWYSNLGDGHLARSL
jgi:hypothetical protein